jgi:hypothetical protein
MNAVECLEKMGQTGSTSTSPYEFPPGTTFRAGRTELPMADGGTGPERAAES